MTHTILITGANRGIGLELARNFAAAGDTVIGTARHPDEATELADIAQRVERLDHTNPDSVRTLASALADTAIDILINNGATGPESASFEDLDPTTLVRDFEINSVGPVRVTQAMLPHLRKRSRKTVVSITSQLGSIELAQGSGGYIAYRTSKAALNMLNACAAHELGKEGFTCAVLHPGWVRTRMGGENAPVTPEESSKGLHAVINKLTTDDNGRFLDHTGAELPW
jgi:NAD(P)-dependent dehydrogenase (short-subunit alcohol dehydrogenase family)